MNDLEMQLKDLLAQRASTHSHAVPQMRRTLARARMRRVANGGVAVLAVVALATGTFVGAQEFLRADDRTVEVANPGAVTTEGAYGFTSAPGEYPVVASGEFRGARWELTTSTFGERGIDVVNLQLSVSKAGHVIREDVDIAATDDVLLLRHLAATSEMLDGADVVFGAMVSGVKTVDVEVADGNDTTIQAHTFKGYDSHSTITADYYIAFVPAESPGFVHARDELGIDLELEPFGRVSLAPHVVATGKVAGADWSVEFGAVEKDRACVVFAPDENGSECFSREEIENAGPLLVVTFERTEVLGVVAIMSDQVGHVRLVRADGETFNLPSFQPEEEDLGEWPLRLVAVGLEPGSHGTLQALGGPGELLLEEDF